MKDVEEYGRRILRTWVLNVEGGMKWLRFFPTADFCIRSVETLDPANGVTVFLYIPSFACQTKLKE